MAKINVPMTPKIQGMAQRIRDFANSIQSDHDDMLVAKETVNTFNAGMTVTRLDVCAKVAELSAAEKWLPREIEEACTAAKKLTNRPAEDATNRTVGVFCSQLHAVAHPKVRNQFPTILAACREAWADETMADSDAPKPVHKFKGREYTLIMSACVAVKNDELVVVDADSIVQWAIENDPDFDPDKVEKRLRAVAAQLQEIANDFGDDQIADACTYLSTISADDLLKSLTKKRAAEKAAEAKRMGAHKLTSVAVTPVAPVTLPEPEVSAPESQESPESTISGVYDPLADTLNDAGVQLAIAA